MNFNKTKLVRFMFIWCIVVPTLSILLMIPLLNVLALDSSLYNATIQGLRGEQYTNLFGKSTRLARRT